MLLLAVSWVGLPRFLMPTTTLNSKSFNTSFLEVMICSKNKLVFICDLSNLRIQIIFDAWWASMNVDSKHPVAWNNSWHLLPWRLYFHCGIEETSCPGIICIVFHHVLRHPSEHGTGSMGKHLLAKVHIAQLNKFTKSKVNELTSSTVHETALARLKRQGSRELQL